MAGSKWGKEAEKEDKAKEEEEMELKRNGIGKAIRFYAEIRNLH